MGRSWVESITAEPFWLLLGVYATLAAVLAATLASAVKRSLHGLARRSPSNLAEVIAATVPRPLGGALFLAEISGGLRWLPLPAGLEAVTKHLLPFALAILAVLLLMRMSRRAIEAFGRSNPSLRSTAGIAQATTWVIGLSLTAVLLSDAIGISLAPVLTALGVGSLAVALALQDTLTNFFSGISLVTDKPVRPGDFVRLEGSGSEGYVETLGWRSTHLRTLDGGVVVIPNATLAKGVITNFGATNPRLVLRVRVDVALDSEVDRVEAALTAEANECAAIEGVRGEPLPAVRFVPGVGREAFSFTVVFRLEPSADGDLVEHLVKKRLHARLVAEKIKPPICMPAGGEGMRVV
jgi:small-conductance mechanosensitive channel